LKKGRELTLATGVGHPVLERVGREEAHLGLHRGNRMHSSGPLDRRRRDLAQPNRADPSLGHQLRERLHRRLDGDVGVHPRALEDVDLFGPVQDAQRLFDVLADVLGRGIGGTRLEVEGALDAEHHLVGILGVLGEVRLEQVQRVVVGRAVEDTLASMMSDISCHGSAAGRAYPVPEVGAIVQRRLHGLNGLFDGQGVPEERQGC
jgi:hypothetical protein